MFRTVRRLILCAAGVAAAAALTIPATSGAASTCKLSASQARKMGPTYVTLLRVSGTSCSTGIAVTKAYHTCRLKHGKRGTCRTTVRGYRCTDRRPAAESIPTQFTGHVTCKRGSARITHDYQQDT